MDRYDLACEVIKAAQDHCKGFVYGGFVRDLLSKDEFNDVNIFVPYGITSSQIDCMLDSIPNTANFISGLIASTYSRDLLNHIFQVIDKSNNQHIKVNLCYPINEQITSPFVKDTDVDINYLYANLIDDKFGESFVIDVDKCIDTFKHKSIVQCINNKQFYSTNKTSLDRIRNLEKKGYKNLSAANSSISSYDSISAKPKCIHCNGTKVLDFEFYTRTCFECD